MIPADALITFLLVLENEGWGWKLSSSPEEPGRLYRARVWRHDSAGVYFNGKGHSPDPLTALRLALTDGERKGRNRERHIRAARPQVRRAREGVP